MGKSRLDLQAELESVLGSRNVYYQPPTSKMISYDAIVYSKGNGYQRFADNKTYNYTHSYALTVIYKHPDSDITDRLVEHFQMIYVERTGIVIDGLYHDYLKLYY